MSSESIRRFDLAGRSFLSSYYLGTARAVAAIDGGVRVGFTIPRRIFRISDQGRGAPLGRLALRTLRRVTPPLVRPLLGGDSGARRRPAPLVGDHVERPRGACARRGRGHVDRRRSGDTRARRRGGSRRRGHERSSDIHVYTGNVKAAVRLFGALALVVCALLGFAAAFGLAAKAGAGTAAPAQATEPPTSTQPPTEPTPTEPPVEPPAPAPIAFGVTVGGVKVGGMMPYRAGEGRPEGILTPASARRRRDAHHRARARRARREAERAEGRSPRALRASGCARAARRRGLAGARSHVRRPPRQRRRPGGARRAHRPRGDEATRGRSRRKDGISSGSPPDVRSGPRSRRTAARRSACRTTSRSRRSSRPSSTRLS